MALVFLSVITYDVITNLNQCWPTMQVNIQLLNRFIKYLVYSRVCNYIHGMEIDVTPLLCHANMTFSTEDAILIKKYNC